MLKSLAFASAMLCALLVTPNAEARPRAAPSAVSCVETVMIPCYLRDAGKASPSSRAEIREARRVARGQHIADRLGYGGVADRPAPRVRKVRQHQVSAYGVPSPDVGWTVRSAASAIVAHPAGCPSRAFCGCGAAVRVFGAPVRSLWLAANWFKFPRSQPAAGMVAVRRHHVFVLEQYLGGSTWLAYDANSGRHATRIHARSIAGYTIVNPRGAG